MVVLFKLASFCCKLHSVRVYLKHKSNEMACSPRVARFKVKGQAVVDMNIERNPNDAKNFSRYRAKTLDLYLTIVPLAIPSYFFFPFISG